MLKKVDADSDETRSDDVRSGCRYSFLAKQVTSNENDKELQLIWELRLLRAACDLPFSSPLPRVLRRTFHRL